MPRTPESGETLYRLADGLFPLRLEPGEPLLMGREGSPLRIELRTREKHGVDVILVYDPSGQEPTADALLHALSPLAGLPGDRCAPPLDAPPNAVAFHFDRERAPQREVGAAPGPAHSAPSAGIEAWLDKARLEGMLWTGLDAARAGGRHARDVIMAVFDGCNLPGRKLLIASQLERGLSPAEAARQTRETVHAAVSQGGRLLFQIVDTPEQVRVALETGGVLQTHGPLLDAGLSGDVPEGHVRAFLFEDAAVQPRLVAVRSPGERAAEAKAEEQDAILQAVLDRVGEDVRAQHAARRERGNAAHNLAILVEELAGGELTALVAMRSEVARAIESWGSERTRPITKALERSAPAGMTHAVFAMRRETTIVMVHRMTVVQGLGTN